MIKSIAPYIALPLVLAFSPVNAGIFSDDRTRPEKLTDSIEEYSDDYAEVLKGIRLAKKHLLVGPDRVKGDLERSIEAIDKLLSSTALEQKDGPAEGEVISAIRGALTFYKERIYSAKRDRSMTQQQIDAVVLGWETKISELGALYADIVKRHEVLSEIREEKAGSLSFLIHLEQQEAADQFHAAITALLEEMDRNIEELRSLGLPAS